LTLSAGHHSFDDVAVGDVISLGKRCVTEEMIDQFAKLTGDHFEIHMDINAAQKHGFSGRVAHGLLILALVDGLKNQADAQFNALASLGWDWNFLTPVLAGDEIEAQLMIASKRKTSNPNKGILHITFTVKNQAGECVQEGTNTLMVYR
jgi:acyl dehydratase